MTATETAPPEIEDDVTDLRTLEPVTETVTDRAAARADAAGARPRRAEPRTSRVVLKRVHPWSVLKLSLLFYLCLCVALLVASVALWTGASAAGIVGNVESFFRDAGFEGFRFSAGQLLRGFVFGGLILVMAGTVANLLLAVLFNLMSEVVGGIRVTLGEDRDRRR